MREIFLGFETLGRSKQPVGCLYTLSFYTHELAIPELEQAPYLGGGSNYLSGEMAIGWYFVNMRYQICYPDYTFSLVLPLF